MCLSEQHIPLGVKIEWFMFTYCTEEQLWPLLWFRTIIMDMKCLVFT
jgi:hypothetical protein